MMDSEIECQNYSYSWHQSHDQVTVLLMVPYEASEEDVVVSIHRNYVLAGVQGQRPILKGCLYGNIDKRNSLWQLEPKSFRLSARERTISTTSTASTHSSYAFVSDPDISSSFAASLESGEVSEAEDAMSTSPSRPASSSGNGLTSFRKRRTLPSFGPSRSVSPRHVLRSLSSSVSSLESINGSHSGRLLTLHLEKEHSMIWPSLIVGPLPDSHSSYLPISPTSNTNVEMELKYNMDPTSMVMLGLELFDIRKEKEDAFEYFVRAWREVHVPSATMRIVTNYLPLPATLDTSHTEEPASRGTLAYYVQSIGGPSGLAQLYLEAGLLHLEGSTPILLSSSLSTLSSIRVPPQINLDESSTEAWKRDRDAAGRYFERAHALQPELEVPLLPSEGMPLSPQELQMPSLDLNPAALESLHSISDASSPAIRRRRKKEEMELLEDHQTRLDEIDNTWYLYIPGLVGAGTALLVVGVVGALSFSSWRRNQGS